jgi:hypothetical protein
MLIESMHSLGSLREIRAMESVLGSGNEGYSPSWKAPQNILRQPTGPVVAIARFNLRTREITVVPVTLRK